MTIVFVSSRTEWPQCGTWSVWNLDDDRLGDLPDGWSAAAVSELTNAHARRIRNKLVDLDGELFSGCSVLAWAASSIGERNPYTSDFAYRVAGAIALLEAAVKGGDIVLQTADHTLRRALAEICRRAGFDVQWRGRLSSGPKRPRMHPRRLLALARDWSREIKASRKYKLTPIKLHGHAIWLVTWAGPDTFQPSSLLNSDRYFGKIPSLLRQAGITFGYVGIPINWIARIDTIASNLASANNITTTLSSAFVRPFGLVRAVMQAFRMPKAAKPRLVIDGLDLSPLAERAMAQEIGADVAVRAGLFQEIGRECKRLGIAPEVLIYPFENQPWEKQLIAGFRRYCPDTKLVGFQHTVFAASYLSGDPSRWQMDNDLFPDLLIASGVEYRDRLIRCGLTEERILVGGALRFPQFTLPVAAPRTLTRLHSILASLPLQPEEARELSITTAEATAGLGLELVISFHPLLDKATRASIRHSVGAGPHVAFSDAPARELLQKADLLVYNSSGTVFDAAAAGVPSLYVGLRARPDLDKLPGGNPLACRETAGLRAILTELLANPGRLEAQTSMQRERMKTAFSAPDDEYLIKTFRSLTKRSNRVMGI